MGRLSSQHSLHSGLIFEFKGLFAPSVPELNSKVTGELIIAKSDREEQLSIELR